MLQIKITKTESQFHELASQLNGIVQNGILKIPEHLGKGQISRQELTGGIILQDGEYSFYEDVTISRKVSEDERIHHFSILYVFDLPNFLESDDDGEKKGANNYILFFNKHHSYNYFTPAYTRLKQVHLFVSVDKILSLCKYYHLPIELSKNLISDNSWYYKFPLTAEIQKVLHQLASYKIEDQFTRGYMINKSEELIMLTLEQLQKEQSKTIDQQNFIHQDDLKTVFEAEKLLLQSHEDNIKITELADQLSIGIRKLQRLFKAYHGVDMTAYRKKVRLEQARQMILEQRLSITDISYKMGYTSTSHFSRIFKDHFGYPPSSLLNKTTQNEH